MTDLRLFTVTWETDTAGVSPHENKRTEIFFKGCNKAITGNACLGCFNKPLWGISKEDELHEINEVANQIIKYAPHKFVTIGGGEPTDQPQALLALTKQLKEAGFHIMVYTWKDLDYMLTDATGERAFFVSLLNNIDMLVDGIFDPAQRLYNGKAKDGFFSSIGSGNQTIWDTHTLWRDKDAIKGYKMRDIQAMKLEKLGKQFELVYMKNNQSQPVTAYL